MEFARNHPMFTAILALLASTFVLGISCLLIGGATELWMRWKDWLASRYYDD